MKKYYIAVGVALLTSLFIYLFYRTEKTVVNILFDFLTNHQMNDIRNNVRQTFPLPSFIIYSIPEGLWVFSATLLSKNIYIRIVKLNFHLGFLPFLYAILLEFVQLFHILHGHFDWMDILFSTLCWLVAFYIPSNIKATHISLQPSSNTFKLMFVYGIVFLSHVSH